MPLWEVFGWAGSVLVVLSLMVPSVRKFRILNLIGSSIATVYNVYFEIWPYAAMNGAIVLINIYWLWRLHQEGSTQDRGYSVVNADRSEVVVRRFLARNDKALASAYPSFTASDLDGARTYLVMHEEEIIGLFALRPDGEIVLDFVTERFRDLTPGHFVYSNKDVLEGLPELRISSEATTDPGYFKKQGFENRGDVLVKSL